MPKTKVRHTRMADDPLWRGKKLTSWAGAKGFTRWRLEGRGGVRQNGIPPAPKNRPLRIAVGTALFLFGVVIMLLIILLI